MNKEKTSYSYRFEEMIESRKSTIENASNVVKEQKYLISVLEKDDENSEIKHFETLISELKKQVEETEKSIDKLKQKNLKTKCLIELLKDEKNDSICTLVIDELEIFKK